MKIKNKIILNSISLSIFLICLIYFLLRFNYLIEVETQIIIISLLCFLLCIILYLSFKIYLFIIILKEINKKDRIERNFRWIPPKMRYKK